MLSDFRNIVVNNALRHGELKSVGIYRPIFYENLTAVEKPAPTLTVLNTTTA